MIVAITSPATTAFRQPREAHGFIPMHKHNHQENGWFGTHGPAGTRLFTSSLVTQCSYEIGLWLGISILG